MIILLGQFHKANITEITARFLLGFWFFVNNKKIFTTLKCLQNIFLQTQRPFSVFSPPEGSIITAHLLIAVSDDRQVEKLAAMLFGQDRVNSSSVWSSQLLIHCQIIRWQQKQQQKEKKA